MTYEQLVAMMESWGVFMQTLQLDKTYALPKKDWVLGEFRESLERWARDAGVLEWKAEAGDCDDFACWGRAHAKTCMARMGKPEALAIGEFMYEEDRGGSHAVVFAVVEDGGLVFLDRKKNGIGVLCVMEVILSQDERESCFGWFI